ncbi:MAG: tetratricopeptide repeat protein, partial [Bacteroidales bacterium]
QFFEMQQYEAARQGFAAYRAQLKDTESEHYVDAAYYETASAMYLNHSDAAGMVKRFNEKWPASRWVPQMKFHTAKSLFARNEFEEAEKAFNELNISDLNRQDQFEFAYKLAYCQMQDGNNDTAVSNFNIPADTVNPYQTNAIYYRSHLYYLNNDLDKALDGFSKIQNEKQFSKAIPLYIMQIHYREGEYDQVLSVGEDVLHQVEPRRKAEVARMMADAWYRQKDYAKALEFYAQSEKGGSRFMGRQDQYQYAICQFKTGNFSESISHFQKVVQEDDALTQNAYYYLGLCYNETKQSDFAKNAFLAAHKATFDEKLSEDALFNYVKLSLASPPGPYNESLQLLDNYIAKGGSRTEEASEFRVRLFLHLRDYNAALISLENMKNRKGEYQSIYEKLTFSYAAELFSKSDFQAASTQFSKIIAAKGDALSIAKARFWQAECSFRMKNYAESKKQYTTFIGLRDAAKLDVYPLALYGLGYSFFNLKDYSAAQPSFKQLIQNGYPKDQKVISDAKLRLADCNFISRNYEQAKKYYDEVASSRKQDADYAFFQQAQCLGALKNYREKTVSLDQLIKNYPKSVYYDQALYDLASTNLILDDKRAAIANFNKLITERPRSKYTREALLKTGMLYYNNDQNEQAIAVLKKVVENYPSSDDSREALNILRSIYMEMNKLNEYFAYVNKGGLQQETVSEKDSLSFVVAERLYQESSFAEANKALSSYIAEYSNGSYLLKANYYLAKCLLRDNAFDTAWLNIKYVIDFQDNEFTDEMLLLAARAFYDQEKYADAGTYYTRLQLIADLPKVKLEALEGSMKSSYFTGDYSNAIESSALLLNSSGISPDQSLQAHYIAGKCYYEQQKFNEAKKELLTVAENDRGRFGAEANFLIASIFFENGQFSESKKLIFNISERFSSYDYWVAKAFILLADVYVKEDNVFQARETLKSIVDNYQGEDLRKIASDKLKSLKQPE